MVSSRALVPRNPELREARVALERDLAGYLTELRAYCYRMLGSAADAEDAVQDTLVRAWRHVDGFEGRSSLRSWLYRIATNVCLDVIARRKRREMPAGLGAPGRPEESLGHALPHQEWVEPVADAWVVPQGDGVDPAEQAAVRDSVRLAFVAALQALPPRQRAALILRDVLAWRPPEIAALLGTTVVSVNSALQRARQTLATLDTGRRLAGADAIPADLLRRYVDAFERYDIDGLVALLHEDATWTMPPYRLWLRGVGDIRVWLGRKPCGEVRFVPLALNGSAGFAAYTATPAGAWEAFGVQVLEVRDGAIAGAHTFLDPRLVTLFGLSPVLGA
jgi:RNA polymerase sigma-70 factor (ECF subfamily)